MQQQLILDLFDHQMIKSGQFTLKSGKQSYIYADIRTAISYPAIFKQICDQFYQMLQNLNYDFICGVPYSALTFASGIAYAHNIPMLLKRKEAKEYGTKKILEGNYKPGQTCILLEDVITTGASLLETIQVLAEHGLVITDICTLIDREQGGRKHLEEIGYQVHSIMSLRQIIEVLEQTSRISLADKHHALALMKE
ncbi:MAG: orotate phosphoribosyltransferase [Burkholderiales bacterium]